MKLIIRMEYEIRNQKKEAKQAAVYKIAEDLKKAQPDEYHAVNLK